VTWNCDRTLVPESPGFSAFCLEDVKRLNTLTRLPELGGEQTDWKLRPFRDNRDTAS
jgi:hypothetical protein